MYNNTMMYFVGIIINLIMWLKVIWLAIYREFTISRQLALLTYYTVVISLHLLTLYQPYMAMANKILI